MFVQNTSQIEFIQTVFILGGSGFVGSNLKAHLSQRNVSFQSPSSAEINLKLRVTHKLLGKCFTPTTALVLLACITPDKGRGATSVLDNISIVQTVSEAIKARRVGYVIYMSANGVYEDYQSPCHESILPTPRSLYGLMHLIRETILREVCASQNIPCMILRPGSIYGPGDPHGFYGPTRFLKQAQSENIITLFGHGEETRDHIYISDVVRVLELCLMNRTEGVLNVASGQPVTFLEIYDMINNLVNRNIELKTMPRGIGKTISHREISVRTLLDTFPGLQLHSVEEGMKNTLLCNASRE